MGRFILGTLALFLSLSLLSGVPPFAQETTERLIEQGLLLHAIGEYEKAMALFKRSIEIRPTAMGHTYLAWSMSHLGRLEEAIEEAKKAIELDPNFGNPYNDIGAYLIGLGRLEEAIPYLKKAMVAKNYCCYFFPHFNMGRIHVARGEYGEALREFEEALRIEPRYLPARIAIEAIKSYLKETF